jgi:hypothetical protein
LGMVQDLMGKHRVNKIIKRNINSSLSAQDKWGKIVQFLKDELKFIQEVVVEEKSRQPVCSAKASSEKPSKFEKSEGHGSKNKYGNVSMNNEAGVICNICGKNNHKTYVSPYTGLRKVGYLACDKFLGMSPRDRCKILDKKGFCRQCLSTGVKKGHDNCKTTYMCQNSSHDSNSEGYHVLVCDQHKNTPENAKLLQRFKDEFIQRYEEGLPSTSKNVKITMHSQANCAGMASEEGETTNKGIFMLQTINVQGELFNLFYDSGCGDLVCKKSAIDKLVSLGRASRELSGPITLSGVGDKKTVCRDGTYKITLPLNTGKQATMSGLCLDKVTGKFPVFSLKTVEDDVKDHYQQKLGKDPEELPRLPDKVGGETDIMIGIKYLKYFPKEIHKLSNGLTIYESMFENSDGSLGVVAGPHPSFSDEWENVGQVAYSYEVMPEVTQYRNIHAIGMGVPLLGWWENLESPDHNPNPTPTTATCADVLTSRRAPKISQIFDKLENAGTEITYRCKDCRECPECKKSDRFESISIQEEIEQTVIEKSVNVDISKGRTIAKLPFLSNPVHKLRPNMGIGLKVYQSQLKKLGKSAMDMDHVLKSEKKLHELGFVDFVDNLCDEDRNMIHNSEVKYFIPWRGKFPLTDGGYSCQLVFARTKIVPKDMSVPRAELLAATLNATTGHVVKTSFGNYFEKSMKLTDSQIALFWINSTRSELKLWARNRVIEINRLTELNSWRYVRSCDMIADLGTRKGAQIEDMKQSGQWVKGKPWMRLPESEFPVSTVSQITLCSADRSEASNECNKPDITDQICSLNSWCYAQYGGFSGAAVPDQVKTRYESSQYLIDPNLPLGLGNKVECLEDLDIITPNRLLLGRNNNRCPSGPLTAQESFKRILDTNKEIYDTWFRSWLKSYVPTLVDRPKWLTSNDEVRVGDVVLFLKSEKEFERDYQYGIIHTVNVGRDGHIRVVEVEYQNHNEGVKRYTTRGVRDLVIIQPIDEPGINAELAEIAQ